MCSFIWYKLFSLILVICHRRGVRCKVFSHDYKDKRESYDHQADFQQEPYPPEKTEMCSIEQQGNEHNWDNGS